MLLTHLPKGNHIYINKNNPHVQTRVAKSKGGGAVTVAKSQWMYKKKYLLNIR